MNDQIMEAYIEEYPQSAKITINSKNKIPLSIDDFLIWMVESKTEVKFYFNMHHYGMLLYVIGNRLYAEIIIDSTSLSHDNAKYKHKKFRTYKGDDIAFVDAVKRIKFTVFNRDTTDDWLEKPTVGELSYYFDVSLKENYQGSGKILHDKYKSAVKKFMEKLNGISDLYNIESRPKSEDFSFIGRELPGNIKKSGENVKFWLHIKYNSLTNKDKTSILLKEDQVEDNLRQELENYLDFVYYVINIKDFKFHYDIYTNHKKITNCNIRIILSTELILSNEYYETIGYYKLFLKNICVDRNFQSKDFVNVAEELSIDIADLDEDSICDILKNRINKLQWSDFEK